MVNNEKSRLKELKMSVIGLGLIGGSLARAFNERLGIKEITAYNRTVDALDEALRDKNIMRGFSELNEYAYDSDIVFICTPVKKTIEYIDALSLKVKSSCIITDVGSTKGELTRYVNSMKTPINFIGGHPMAGTEKTGYAVSFSHLFENAYYVLTPSCHATEQALETMTQIVGGIGAIPVVMDAEEHDRVTGGISHLPHVLASALVNLVRDLDSTDGCMHMLAAGGFRDITRIASSSPEMWENIVSSNSGQLRELLEYFEKILDRFKENMALGNSSEILDFFSDAKKYRDSMSATKKGLIAPSYEIIIDVVDKPGIIGEIATILGCNNINIKNINVSNNREFEQGCLIITLSDSDSVNIAFDLLAGKGYKIYRYI